MKKIMIAAAVMAMTCGFSLRADNNNQGKNCPVAARCDTTGCFGPRGCAPAFCEFDGIQLTDAQKAQLKTLKEKGRADRATKQQAKQERKAQKRAGREAARKSYLDELKKILSPEQYLQYLENSYVRGGAKAGKPGKDVRGDKKGFKGGPRGQRPGGPRPEAPAAPAK